MLQRKVIVIGATGEIGGRIANLAVKAGHKVYGVTRGTNKAAQVSHEGVEMICGDKYNKDFLKELRDKVQADALIDTIPNDTVMPLYWKIFGDSIQNYMYCGSMGVYAPLQYIPADENHPWEKDTGVNFHHASLWDIGAFNLHKTEGYPVTMFRPTNIIGRDRVPLDLWGGRSIKFYKMLKANQPIPLAPCENILIQSGYNWDLASAFVLALQKPEEIKGQIFNISCKRAITLGQFLQTAMDFLGSKSEIVHLDPQTLCKLYPEDVRWRYGLEFLLQNMCVDISKAEKTFGYAPKKTTQEGLIEALTWCTEAGLLD